MNPMKLSFLFLVMCHLKKKTNYFKAFSCSLTESPLMDEREEHLMDWKLHYVVSDRERIVSEVTTTLPIYEEDKKNLTRTGRSDPKSLIISPKT